MYIVVHVHGRGCVRLMYAPICTDHRVMGVSRRVILAITTLNNYITTCLKREIEQT